jgi:hypothetical protein
MKKWRTVAVVALATLITLFGAALIVRGWIKAKLDSAFESTSAKQVAPSVALNRLSLITDIQIDPVTVTLLSHRNEQGWDGTIFEEWIFHHSGPIGTFFRAKEIDKFIDPFGGDFFPFPKASIVAGYNQSSEKNVWMSHIKNNQVERGQIKVVAWECDNGLIYQFTKIIIR